MTAAAPVVKWVGGKSRLLPALLERLPAPAPGGRYFEPFAGGAAVFFATWQSLRHPALLSDANPDLMQMYQVLRGLPEELIRAVQVLAAHHDREHYLAVRARWNDPASSWDGDGVERAAAFLYLNRACFNGLWRVNRAGKLNTPPGNGVVVFDEGAMRGAREALLCAEVRCCDYREALATVGDGDVVYLDPPYDGTSIGYAPAPFGSRDQAALAQVARDLVARGASVLASNADTPLVRELYRGFQIDSIEARYVAGGGGRLREVREVLIWSPRPRLVLGWAHVD